MKFINEPLTMQMIFKYNAIFTLYSKPNQENRVKVATPHKGFDECNPQFITAYTKIIVSGLNPSEDIGTYRCSIEAKDQSGSVQVDVTRIIGRFLFSSLPQFSLKKTPQPFFFVSQIPLTHSSISSHQRVNTSWKSIRKSPKRYLNWRFFRIHRL